MGMFLFFPVHHKTYRILVIKNQTFTTFPSKSLREISALIEYCPPLLTIKNQQTGFKIS